jgi:small nuclear ribonucleoprotein (snRNP)-like protein
MDPISIVGVAASIVTFIDFTQKLLSLALGIHDDQKQCELEHKTLEEVTLALKSLAEKLPPQGSGQSSEQADMARLASHCRDLANDILRRLDKNKAKKRTLFGSFRSASLTIWSRSEITQLQGRLHQYVNQLNLHLTAISRYNKISIKFRLPYAGTLS